VGYIANDSRPAAHSVPARPVPRIARHFGVNVADALPFEKPEAFQNGWNSETRGSVDVTPLMNTSPV